MQPANRPDLRSPNESIPTPQSATGYLDATALASKLEVPGGPGISEFTAEAVAAPGYGGLPTHEIIADSNRVSPEVKSGTEGFTPGVEDLIFKNGRNAPEDQVLALFGKSLYGQQVQTNAGDIRSKIITDRQGEDPFSTIPYLDRNALLTSLSFPQVKAITNPNQVTRGVEYSGDAPFDQYILFAWAMRRQANPTAFGNIDYESFYTEIKNALSDTTIADTQQLDVNGTPISLTKSALTNIYKRLYVDPNNGAGRIPASKINGRVPIIKANPSTQESAEDTILRNMRDVTLESFSKRQQRVRRDNLDHDIKTKVKATAAFKSAIDADQNLTNPIAEITDPTKPTYFGEDYGRKPFKDSRSEIEGLTGVLEIVDMNEGYAGRLSRKYLERAASLFPAGSTEQTRINNLLSPTSGETIQDILQEVLVIGLKLDTANRKELEKIAAAVNGVQFLDEFSKQLNPNNEIGRHATFALLAHSFLDPTVQGNNRATQLKELMFGVDNGSGTIVPADIKLKFDPNNLTPIENLLPIGVSTQDIINILGSTVGTPPNYEFDIRTPPANTESYLSNARRYSSLRNFVISGDIWEAGTDPVEASRNQKFGAIATRLGVPTSDIPRVITRLGMLTDPSATRDPGVIPFEDIRNASLNNNLIVGSTTPNHPSAELRNQLNSALHPETTPTQTAEVRQAESLNQLVGSVSAQAAQAGEILLRDPVTGQEHSVTSVEAEHYLTNGFNEAADKSVLKRFGRFVKDNFKALAVPIAFTLAGVAASIAGIPILAAGVTVGFLGYQGYRLIKGVQNAVKISQKSMAGNNSVGGFFKNVFSPAAGGLLYGGLTTIGLKTVLGGAMFPAGMLGLMVAESIGYGLWRRRGLDSAKQEMLLGLTEYDQKFKTRVNALTTSDLDTRFKNSMNSLLGISTPITHAELLTKYADKKKDLSKQIVDARNNTTLTDDARKTAIENATKELNTLGATVDGWMKAKDQGVSNEADRYHNQLLNRNIRAKTILDENEGRMGLFASFSALSRVGVASAGTVGSLLTGGLLGSIGGEDNGNEQAPSVWGDQTELSPENAQHLEAQIESTTGVGVSVQGIHFDSDSGDYYVVADIEGGDSNADVAYEFDPKTGTVNVTQAGLVILDNTTPTGGTFDPTDLQSDPELEGTMRMALGIAPTAEPEIIPLLETAGVTTQNTTGVIGVFDNGDGTMGAGDLVAVSTTNGGYELHHANDVANLFDTHTTVNGVQIPLDAHWAVTSDGYAVIVLEGETNIPQAILNPQTGNSVTTPIILSGEATSGGSVLVGPNVINGAEAYVVQPNDSLWRLMEQFVNRMDPEGELENRNQFIADLTNEGLESGNYNDFLRHLQEQASGPRGEMSALQPGDQIELAKNMADIAPNATARLISETGRAISGAQVGGGGPGTGIGIGFVPSAIEIQPITLDYSSLTPVIEVGSVAEFTTGPAFLPVTGFVTTDDTIPTTAPNQSQSNTVGTPTVEQLEERLNVFQRLINTENNPEVVAGRTDIEVTGIPNFSEESAQLILTDNNGAQVTVGVDSLVHIDIETDGTTQIIYVTNQGDYAQWEGDNPMLSYESSDGTVTVGLEDANLTRSTYTLVVSDQGVQQIPTAVNTEGNQIPTVRPSQWTGLNISDQVQTTTSSGQPVLPEAITQTNGDPNLIEQWINQIRDGGDANTEQAHVIELQDPGFVGADSTLTDIQTVRFIDQNGNQVDLAGDQIRSIQLATRVITLTDGTQIDPIDDRIIVISSDQTEFDLPLQSTLRTWSGDLGNPVTDTVERIRDLTGTVREFNNDATRAVTGFYLDNPDGGQPDYIFSPDDLSQIRVTFTDGTSATIDIDEALRYDTRTITFRNDDGVVMTRAWSEIEGKTTDGYVFNMAPAVIQNSDGVRAVLESPQTVYAPVITR